MNHDFTTGILISAAIHCGVIFGDRLMTPKPKPTTAIQTHSTIELITMPNLDLDEPERLETSEATVTPDIVPPMQPDVPQMPLDLTFVQLLQPHRPATTRPSGIVTIPSDRSRIQTGKPEVFDVSNLDQHPVPTFQPGPRYPSELRRTGADGEVLVDFIVDTNGDVQAASARRSTHREFEAAAVQAVSRWTFKPGRRAGKKVLTQMQVPIIFTLTSN